MIMNEVKAAFVAAVANAKEQWTGLDWTDGDNDIVSVRDALHKVVPVTSEDDDRDTSSYEQVRRARKMLAGVGDSAIGSHVPDDGQGGHREGLRLLRDWIAQREYTEETMTLAEKLADESIAYVESRARAAAAFGDAAVADVADDRWDDALSQIRQACRAEREFGDSPCWRQALVIVEAVVKGEADGEADVETVFNEQGIAAVVATLAPGHAGWDEGAINAGAAKTSSIVPANEGYYYAAYAARASARALELRDEEEIMNLAVAETRAHRSGH